MSLPTDWRKCIAPDGRTYYQNDITQQTQWNAPTLQQKAPLGTNNRTCTVAESTNLITRKIWDKEHLIWLFFFVLTIVDLSTDLQVVSLWMNLQSLCPQFHCKTVHDFFFPMEAAAMLMLTFSIIGFIIGLIFKAYEAKSLYSVYKNPMTEQQVLKNDLTTTYKKTMRYGWIPLIIEDAVSMLLIIIAMGQGVWNFVGLSRSYTRSLLVSTVTSSASTLYGFFKYKKFNKVTLDQHDAFEIDKARSCHKCWCCCVMTIISLLGYITMGYVLVVLTLNENAALIELKEDSTRYSNGIATFTESCEYFGYSGAANESYVGEITKAPVEIFTGCLGSDYEYTVKCIPDRSDEFAVCGLEWNNYDGNNTINCDNVNLNSKCEFKLYVGVCGEYTIVCNNSFGFAQGNPAMYACIDYCDDS